MLWEARLYFACKRNGERQFPFYFEQVSREQAIADCFRIAREREQAYASMREIYGWDDFKELLCVKLYEFNPQPLEPNGYCQPPAFIPVFEWKCDTGGPISRYLKD